MTQDQFVRTVAKRSGMTIKQAEKAVDAVFTCAADALAAGETVKIYGFGTFGFREWKGGSNACRIGSDKTVSQNTYKAVSFVPSKKLKARVRDIKGGQ